ncbi:accessory Sec system glycosylation chaperone GtfB [Macrococcoides caseolyticum]|uniref:accessory Sec system glycosylation chaperone GtfB n=1 Tax=Macrococcoides caseolyticum TaxID=69966 RepID=UPI001F45B040|nr:accessory Sec system glycosylation chaperone GtfB [Macrococcus caseolyticus]MCE4957792.1 accessory Sec system glycosylation chaperone GtfB [Macrococcus caseolyticus]
MINLFNVLDKSSLEIYSSFKNALMNPVTVIIEDSGFLPLGMKSPYQFFADYQISNNARPKFFNEIEIPEFWEIHGSNQSAHVYYLGEIRANIKYHSHPQLRSVHTVEWLDRDKRIRFIDVYDRFGHRFRQDVYNADGKHVFKLFFDQNNNEIIYENIVTNQIILNWQGKEYIFDSKTKFVQFYLKESGLDYSVLNINSLGVPYFVSIGLSKGQTNLIWQENVHEAIPGNMKNMLFEQKNRDYRVLIPHQTEYDKIMHLLPESVHNKVQLFGYVYQFKRKHQMTNNILIATNSDQLLNFEMIVKACPTYKFHIVAITEMSNTLIQYDQYPNVLLYPKVTKDQLNSLFNQCDIYLDINAGNELHNAVRKAFDANMIIYAFKERAHNVGVTLPSHIFEGNASEALITQLNHLTEEMRYELIQAQHMHANHIGLNGFINTFKSSIE